MGTLFIVGAIVLALYSVGELPSFPTKPGKAEKPKFEDKSFSAFVSRDLQELRDQGQLPKEWAEIQHVAYEINTPFQKELLGDRKIQSIPESPGGRYKLEIQFVDVPDEENPAIILQLSMIEMESGNKVWELGRTYDLKPFLKAPDSTDEKTESTNPEVPKKTDGEKTGKNDSDSPPDSTQSEAEK